MVARVLIIGGYGNFGGYIARRLAEDVDIQLVIGGRNVDQARAFAAALTEAAHPPEWRHMDIRAGLREALADIRPDIVVHTSGPFQGQDYAVATGCIQAGCHYIDLADGRDFVTGIGSLDATARSKGVLVVSGASSVPFLTAAVVDRHIASIQRLTALDYGIATAQRTNRGLATTAAVLSYAGKPFTTLIDGERRTVFGWQDLHRKTLPEAGRRTFANCDIPDLDIFPERYPDLKTIRFYAGLEVPALQVGLRLLAGAVRWRLLPSAAVLAPMLLGASRLFDGMGSDVSAFYMEMTGTSATGLAQTVAFNLTAGSGDGIYIPCVPAIILARRLARGDCTATGAFPCVGFIDLAAYLGELAGLDIRWTVSGPYPTEGE